MEDENNNLRDCLRFDFLSVEDFRRSRFLFPTSVSSWKISWNGYCIIWCFFLLDCLNNRIDGSSWERRIPLVISFLAPIANRHNIQRSLCTKSEMKTINNTAYINSSKTRIVVITKSGGVHDVKNHNENNTRPGSLSKRFNESCSGSALVSTFSIVHVSAQRKQLQRIPWSNRKKTKDFFSR